MKTTEPSKRIAALDGLRGLAAMLVAVSHFANRTLTNVDAEAVLDAGDGIDFSGLQILILAALGNGGGQLGVMVFFTLSSFLMFTLYYDHPVSLGSMRSFFVARVARIFPLYYFAVLLAALSTAVLPYPYIEMPVADIPRHLVFLGGNSVLWTIPPELAFYCLFAVMWFFAGRQHAVLLFVAALFVVFANQMPVVWVSYTFEFFALGFLVYFYHRSGFSLRLQGFRALLALLILLLLFAYHLPAIHKEMIGSPLPMNGWQATSTALFVFLLFVLALELRFLQQLLSSRILGYLGKISFSVYLMHLFVLNAFVHFGWVSPTLHSLVLVMVAIILFSSATYFFIENPMRLWLRRGLPASR